VAPGPYTVHVLTLLLPLLLPAHPGLDGLDTEVDVAIARAEAEVVASPADPDRHFALGLVREANGRRSAALVAYRRAADLDPNAPLLRYRIGVLQQFEGDPLGAIETLRGVTRELPGLVCAHARLGGLLYEVGELEASQGAWLAALAAAERNPRPGTWPQLEVGLAAVQIDLGRPEEARRRLVPILKAYPDYRHASFVMGNALLDLGRDQEADYALARGEGSVPEYPLGPHAQILEQVAVGYDGRMNRARARLRAGDLNAAAGEARAVLKLRAGDPSALILIADCQRLAGDPGAGLRTLEHNARTNPSHLPSQLECAQRAAEALGLAATEDERAACRRLALEQSQRALELAPDAGEAHYVRGLALEACSNPPNLAGALAELLAAHRLGCDANDLWERIARLHSRLGHDAEALRFAELSADHNPWQVGAHLFLAEARLIGGDRAGARAAVADARALDPASPQLARFLARVGDHLREERR
jgi:tetratricopeptide (TPR) repeat protein